MVVVEIATFDKSFGFPASISMGTGVFRANNENFCTFTKRVATIDKLFVAKLYVVKS